MTDKTAVVSTVMTANAVTEVLEHRFCDPFKIFQSINVDKFIFVENNLKLK